MKKIKIADAEVAVKGARRENVPVIFAVHGAGGGAWIWKDIRGELYEDTDVLAVELPGHCASTGEGGSSIDYYREVVREVAYQLGLKKPFVMGHSMGGAIAMSWALKYPDELQGLVLISTGAKLRVNPLVFDALKNDLRAYLVLMAGVAFNPKVDPEIVELATEWMAKVKPEVITGDFRACDAFDVMDKVAQISLPTLVMCGSEDKLTPVKYSEYLAQKIKGAKLKIFSGAGHMLPLERPENLADYIRRFIAK